MEARLPLARRTELACRHIPTTGYTIGKFNQAIEFDGVDDVVALPNNLFATLTSGTISMWFKTISPGVVIGHQREGLEGVGRRDGGDFVQVDEAESAIARRGEVTGGGAVAERRELDDVVVLGCRVGAGGVEGVGSGSFRGACDVAICC